MTDDHDHDEEPLEGGDFSSWLVAIEAAIRGEADADVPCGSCTACCTSSQFVHIGPDETDTLAHIPAELVFPAPRMPKGHVLLGYDERGHCPMLVDNRCSIYEHRPRTCRAYDCRVFPATGIDAGDDKPLIVRQARRWRFIGDTEEQEAVRAAAASVDDRPAGTIPANPTQRAVLAIDIFLGRET